MLGKLALCGAVALGLAACVTTTPAGRVDTSSISLIDRFYQVAFFHEEIGEELPLARYEGPLVFTFVGGTAEDRQRAEAILSQIGTATDLPISTLQESGRADLIIKFVDDAEWQRFVALRREWRETRGLSNVGFDPQCYNSTYSSTGNKPYTVVGAATFPQAPAF